MRRLLTWATRLDLHLTEQLAPTDQAQDRHPLQVWMAQIGAHAGDSLVWAAITAILWRQAGDNPARRRVLIGWIVSLIAALLTTLGIKGVVKRRRPGGGRFLYGGGADVHSFPSGHGARAGVILTWATALHPRFGVWAPFLAAWISWSRVATGVHYVGDVLAGLMLGIGLGGMLRKIWQREADTTR